MMESQSYQPPRLRSGNSSRWHSRNTSSASMRDEVLTLDTSLAYSRQDGLDRFSELSGSLLNYSSPHQPSQSYAPFSQGSEDEDSFTASSRGTSFNLSQVQYPPPATAKRGQPQRPRINTAPRPFASQTSFSNPASPAYRQRADSLPPDQISIPVTARSSIESNARWPRSRTATNNTDVDAMATVRALRADFEAKEAAKDEKYAAVERKAAEKEARRQQRREQNQAKKTPRPRKDSLSSWKGSDNNRSATFSAVEYDSTAALPVDEKSSLHSGRNARYLGSPETIPEKQECDSRSKMPRPAKAVKSGWSLFWFRFKTVWLKLRRGMGGGTH